MGGLISRPVGQDIEMGALGPARNGPRTEAESQHNQAFEQHVDGTGGSNNRRSNIYGSTGRQQVTGNNAPLFVHGNARPFTVDENASRLSARDNHSAFNVRHNAPSSSLTATNNTGRVNIGNNEGTYTSINNTNIEHIDSNSQDVHLQNNNGSHDLGTNTGYVHVDGMGPNGRVHIDHQSGIVHQDFTPGSLMHRLYPNGVDHPATGGSLTLHANGRDNLFHNPVGQFTQHPLRTGAEVVLATGGVIGLAAVYANNAAALPGSGHTSAGDITGNATRIGR